MGIVRKLKRIRFIITNTANYYITNRLFLHNAKHGKIGEKNNTGEKIICSLTTVPARIDFVYLPILSMLHQSMVPDKIILYLDQTRFENITLPENLLSIVGEIFEIRFVKDVRVHTKYYHAFKEYPDSLIITIDDDILYNPNLVKALYNTHKKYPNDVVCSRAHRITIDKSGKYHNYRKWGWEEKSSIPTMQLLATGVGGVLYNPQAFSYSPCKEDLFLELAKNADDLWLKAVEYKNNIKVVTLNGRQWYSEIKGSQEISLNSLNVKQDVNDEYWGNLVKYFSIDNTLFKKE